MSNRPLFGLDYQRRGHPAKGHQDKHMVCVKIVAVRWTPEQMDAINRRVVKNCSSFAHEARRLVDIGLRVDHQS